MKGQLSAEMLIVLAIILGLVFIAFTQMTKSTRDISNAVDSRTGSMIEQTRFRVSEIKCNDDVDCRSFNSTWTCDMSNGYCQE